MYIDIFFSFVSSIVLLFLRIKTIPLFFSVLQSSEETLELENDLQSRITQLQAANSQLFKFALKHIIGEER